MRWWGREAWKKANMYKPSPAQAQADFLLEVLLRAKLSSVNLSGKILRDLLDVIEGTRRGHLNGKQNYGHSTFKEKCLYRSVRAINELKGDPKKQAKNTIRDHALPLKILVQMMMEADLKDTDSLWRLLDSHLVSVVITKEENQILNAHGLAHELPRDCDGNNLFSRYQKVGITVIDTATQKTVSLWPIGDAGAAIQKAS